MVTRNLGLQGQIMDEVEGQFEMAEFVSSELELP